MTGGTEFRFGNHDIDDSCIPSTAEFQFTSIEHISINSGVITIPLDRSDWRFSHRIASDKWQELSRIRNARQKIVDCILSGGTQNEAMASFGHSSVFDPNQYPRDTVIRISGHVYYNSRLALVDPKEEGWHSELGGQFSRLGVVAGGIKNTDHNEVILFEGSEEKLTSTGSARNEIVSYLEIGEWNHARKHLYLVEFRPLTSLLSMLTRHAVRGLPNYPLFDSTLFQEDSFDIVNSVDILSMGKGVKGRVDSKVKSPTRVSFAQKPAGI